MARPISTDLERASARPYFLWDEDVTVEEFRRRLESPDPSVRRDALAKLLREARDPDVWRFVTPRQVAEALPSLKNKLGRKERFWPFIIEGWRRLGLVAG